MFDMLNRAEHLQDEGLDPALKTRIALAELAGQDRDHWSGLGLSERVAELVELRERLDAELLRLLGRWDRSRAWELDGSLSAPAWLSHHTATSQREARRLLKTAGVADRHDDIGHALADGAVTSGHVEAIARVTSVSGHHLILTGSDNARRCAGAAHSPK